MKLQELLEDEQQVSHFNNYDEYVKFLESKANDSDTFHFEQIAASNENEYDIIAQVHDFVSTPGGREPARAETPEEVHGSTEIEWSVIFFGSGDFDNDTKFWVQRGELPLSQKAYQWVEGSLIEKMEGNNSDMEYDERY